MRNLQDMVRKERIEFFAIQETLFSCDASFVVSLSWKHNNFKLSASPASGRSGASL